MISKKPICFLRAAIYASGALAGIFQLLAAFLSFDPNANYFVRGAILPMIACIFALVGVGCAIAFAFLAKATLPEKKPAAFLPPAFFFCALIPCVLSSADGSSKIADRLAIVAIILLIFSVLSCILPFFLKDQKHCGTLALLGIAPVLALAALPLYFYFDKSVEMNAPLKIDLQIGLLFGMFLFLCELRRLLDRPLPRLLIGLRLALFPIASLGSFLLIPLAIAGSFRRLDYLFAGLLLLSLQAFFLFELPSTHSDA